MKKGPVFIGGVLIGNNYCTPESYKAENNAKLLIHLPFLKAETDHGLLFAFSGSDNLTTFA